MLDALHKEFRRICNAFFYSMAGLIAAWKNEAAFRLDVIVSIILLPIAFLLGKNTTEIGLLVFTVFVFLLTELLNSCVETAIDRISDEYHELSKQAKDISSAAVFVSIIALIFVWGLIIFENIF